MAEVPDDVPVGRAPPGFPRPRSILRAAVLGALLAAGCAAPSGAGPAAAPVSPRPAPAAAPTAAPTAAEIDDPGAPAGLTVRPREGAGDLVVARVGGTEIRRSDVGDFAIRFFRDQANEILTQLIDERIIDAEAERLGVDLPQGLVETEVDRELADREREVKARFGAGTEFADYLRERFGATPEAYRADLARLLRVRLLRDRLIRLHQLRTDRVEVRRAVFPTASTAASAAAAARAGADLGRLAAESGLGPETVLPPLPRGAIRPPELEATIFALPAGSVTDPIPVTEGDQTVFWVVKMIRGLPGRDVSFDAVREEIAAGLAAEPVEGHEYLQWAREMRTRYDVSVPR